MRQAILIIAILVVLSVNLPQGFAVRVARNIDIRGEGGADRQVVGPAIAVDPRNPNIIVAGAWDLRLVSQRGCFSASGCHRWAGYYRSTDGGATWSSTLLPGFRGDTSRQGLSSALRHFTGAFDLKVAFDRSGNLYYSGRVANYTDSGQPIFSSQRVFVAKFANDGTDFVRATILPSPGDKGVDLPKIAVDTSGGPNDGNVYLAFLCCSLRTGLFTRSTDGGLSFSKPIPIPGPGGPAGIIVDASGNVLVLSLSASSASAEIQVNKSTDGGLTFGKSVVVTATTPTPSPLPGNSFPFLSTPQVAADANGVFVVWDDFGKGDVNVLFTRSTDGGLTWSRPIIVNDITQGQQFFSTIAVSGGTISVAWYDSRLGQLSNGKITGLNVFYAQSGDGGSSFSMSFKVTSVSFDPNLVESSDWLSFDPFVPFMGWYIGIDATPTAVHFIWTDNRNACDSVDPLFGCVDQDAFTATITL